MDPKIWFSQHIVVIWQNWIQFFHRANIMMVKNVFSLTLANIILSDYFFLILNFKPLENNL